jgi:xylulokinase
MAGDFLLGIDVGTTNCKALILDMAGRVQALAAAPTPLARPRPGWIEHDPAALWATVAALIRQVLAGVPPASVRGVAAASMAEAGLLVDAAGQPLCPIISWNDSRSDPQFRAWLARFGAEQFRALAGNPPSPIFSIFKLLWLRDELPEAYAAAARWLHVSDYIAFRLCGAQATSPSLATRTMLLDLGRQRWSGEIIAAAGLRADLLPPLVPAGARIGAISPAAAADTGLLAGIAVGCGGHDHLSGALAAGVVRGGRALDSMGTAEPALLALGTLPPLHDESPGGSLGAHVVAGRFYISKGIRSAGAAVDWAARTLGLGAASALMNLAAQAQPGAGGVLFLPRLAPADRGGWVGLAADAGAAELARAVLEGLACEWRANLERIERGVGQRAESIRAIGGGTRAALWLQIKADVLGRPVLVLDLPESVALGAALLAGVAAGFFPDAAAAAAQLALPTREVTPDPARAAFYEQHYHQRYTRLPDALGGL